MKTIKIFLGSSITELHDERLHLGDYLMNSVRPIFKNDGIEVEVLKCEDIRSDNTGEKPHERIDNLLGECNVSVFMFKTKAGKATAHELYVARELQKSNRHEIYVFFYDVPEKDKEESLKELQYHLEQESIYWHICRDITDLESQFILGLLKYERQLLGKPSIVEQERKPESMFNNIDEILQNIKTVLANENDTIDSKIFKAIELYKKADRWAAASDYDKEKYYDLLFDYAKFLYDYGFYKDAEAVYLRQISIAKEKYGKEHESTATSYNNIGLVYAALGEYDKALEYYIKALAIREKVLEHPDTATSYNNIAGVYYSRGDYGKALKNYFKALAIREKVLGTEHPDTATSYNNIGAVYNEKSDYNMALEYYVKALKTREKVLGTEHPDTATSYNNIGLVYMRLGDYDKALKYLLKSLKIREEVLGAEHPDTATSYNNIGLVYKRQGEYYKALEYYEKALTIREKVLGMIHPETASSYDNIGSVYDGQRDFDKALEYYEKALEIREKALGTEHPDTATSYNIIGTVYWKQGDYVKAIDYLHKAFSIIDKDQKQFDYESYTYNLLVDYLKDFLKENNAYCLRNYYYSPKGGEHSTRTMCDLAVLNSKGKLLRVYEICTFAAFESNTNYIQKDLNQIKKETGAEVFLAFTVIKNTLVVLSLSEIETINKKRKSIRTETIKSFSEYYSLIKELCGSRVQDRQYFFRGQPDMKYPPLPSIYREGRIEKESYLYHEAIRRNPNEFMEDMSTFDNLVKMQHYELPTRLLDITKNPLVALFFACQKDFEADGEVLVYSILQGSQIKYFDSDSVCILANLAKRPIDFMFNKHKSYLVYDIKKDRPIFDGKILKSAAIHDVLCVLPKLNNNRISKQDGAFFIFGMGKDKKTPAEFLDAPTTIIIKADAKKEILNELELLGINEASLFPETDKVMHQIREEFCEN